MGLLSHHPPFRTTGPGDTDPDWGRISPPIPGSSVGRLAGPNFLTEILQAGARGGPRRPVTNDGAMRWTRLLTLFLVACATPLAATPPAAATDPSGGAMAPADATAEPYTGGSAAPEDPAPAPAAAPARSSAPVVAHTATPTSTPAPVARPAGTAVEPPAGGEQPQDDSPPLEPLPPETGNQDTKPSAKPADSGSGLAMTGGEITMTLTLGIAFLAAGLAAAALSRGRRRRLVSES